MKNKVLNIKYVLFLKDNPVAIKYTSKESELLIQLKIYIECLPLVPFCIVCSLMVVLLVFSWNPAVSTWWTHCPSYYVQCFHSLITALFHGDVTFILENPRKLPHGWWWNVRHTLWAAYKVRSRAPTTSSIGDQVHQVTSTDLLCTLLSYHLHKLIFSFMTMFGVWLYFQIWS